MNIEEFFKKNASKLEKEEPSFGHFNRFNHRLKELHSAPIKETTLNKSNSIALQQIQRVGFAMCFIALIGFVGFNIFKPASVEHIEFNEPIITTNSASKSYVDKRFNNKNVAQAQSSLEQLNQLEADYLRLKFQFSQTNNQAILIDIQSNLTERSRIVNELAEMGIYRSSYSRTIRYASECCGFGDDGVENSHSRRVSHFPIK